MRRFRMDRRNGMLDGVMPDNDDAGDEQKSEKVLHVGTPGLLDDLQRESPKSQ